MKNLFKKTALILVITFIFYCSKEDDNNSSVPTQQPSGSFLFRYSEKHR